MATLGAEPETKRGTTAWLALHIVPALTVTFTATAVISATAAAYITNNFFGPDLGWSVLSTEVRSERNVTIERDLEVSRDLKLGGFGSIVEMAAVTCADEPVSNEGSGRLCFDSSGVFMVSESGAPYRPLAGDKGDKGDKGDPGEPGDDGEDGLHCWDIDGDGIADPNEDLNQDTRYTAADCVLPFDFDDVD